MLIDPATRLKYLHNIRECNNERIIKIAVAWIIPVLTEKLRFKEENHLAIVVIEEFPASNPIDFAIGWNGVIVAVEDRNRASAIECDIKIKTSIIDDFIVGEERLGPFGMLDIDREFDHRLIASYRPLATIEMETIKVDGRDSKVDHFYDEGGRVINPLVTVRCEAKSYLKPMISGFLDDGCTI